MIGRVAPTDGIPPGETLSFTRNNTKNKATPIPISPNKNPPTNESINNLIFLEKLILLFKEIAT